jgi:protoheme IX farnesyltransferase
VLTETIQSPSSSPLGIARDLFLLAKPRLSALVICTAAGGIWLAPGQLDAVRVAVLLAGTTLVVSAANALNCYLERDVDARMRRTRDRPLPAGRLEPWVALTVGLGLPVIALPALAWVAGPLTALLASIALVTYVAIYTPMKQRSTLALFVGAIPGAIPPLLGWTGVTGRIDLRGLALFAVLYFWQLPHFLAVSIYLKEDYARGGIKVFAQIHGDHAAKVWAAVTSVVLVAVTLWLVPLRLAGPGYGIAAALLGCGLCGYGFSGLLDASAGSRWARNFFLVTLAYLTLLLAALFLGAH